MLTWRELWTVALGNDPPMQHLSPITATVLVYALVFVFCYVMYRLSMMLPTILREFALDFFKTLLFCAYPFGHAIVRKYYGNIGYFCAMVPLVMISLTAFPAGEGSVLGTWSKYLRREISVFKFLTRLMVQIAAGIAAYHLGRWIYALDFFWTFKVVLSEVGCRTDLRVTATMGFIIEMVGAGYDFWVFQQRLVTNKTVDLFAKLLNTGTVVCLGFSRTGMYINPVMASGLTFGCKGTSQMEHVMVYWIGPFLGIFLAHLINKKVSLPKLKMEDEYIEHGYQNQKVKVKTNRKYYYSNGVVRKRK